MKKEEFTTCRCGAVLSVSPVTKKVKTFHDPDGTWELVYEIKDHHCKTFDFGSGRGKETKNNNRRLG